MDWHVSTRVNLVNSRSMSWTWPQWANLVGSCITFFSFPFFSSRLGFYQAWMRWSSGLNWRDNRELETKLNEEDKECLTCVRKATILRRHVWSPLSSYGGLPWCCYNHLDGGTLLRWCMLAVALRHHSSDLFFFSFFSCLLPLIIHVLAFFFFFDSIKCVFSNVV